MGHADILVKKAEERTERKLNLLQKLFECKREKILEELEEARYNVEFVNSEIFTPKKHSAKLERKLWTTYRGIIINHITLFVCLFNLFNIGVRIYKVYNI